MKRFLLGMIALYVGGISLAIELPSVHVATPASMIGEWVLIGIGKEPSRGVIPSERGRLTINENGTWQFKAVRGSPISGTFVFEEVNLALYLTRKIETGGSEKLRSRLLRDKVMGGNASFTLDCQPRHFYWHRVKYNAERRKAGP